MGVLFRGIRALLPDMSIRETDVYVEGSKIAALGAPPAGFTADTVVEGKDRLLLPGLVNAHTHTYMTMFRGCADDLPFADWLNGHIDPLEAQMTAEDCYWSTLLGNMEMILNGTTASIDMFIYTETASRAAGKRLPVVERLSDRLGVGLAASEDIPLLGRRVREVLELHEHRGPRRSGLGHAWKGRCSRVTFALGPHAPYSCSEEYLRQVAELASEHDLGLHIHISESKFEQNLIREQYRCTPAELLDKCGILGPKTLAAHGVYLDDEDIALLAQRGTSVVTNPVSNLKLGNGVAPVPKMLSAGVNVALGTDGAASNNALNLFRELSFVTLLHKGLTGDTTVVPAAEALKMATVNGAKALGLAGCGEIREGAKADLTVLDIDKPWLRPRCDLLSSLVYCARGDEVTDVMVDGRFLLRRGELTTIDRERVLYEVDKTCSRLGLLKD